jgi:hypothetical protein
MTLVNIATKLFNLLWPQTSYVMGQQNAPVLAMKLHASARQRNDLHSTADEVFGDV